MQLLFLVPVNNRLHPKELVVFMYESAVFRCRSEKDVVWKFNGRKLPEFLYSERQFGSARKYVDLVINEALSHHDGVYSCHGEGNYHHYFVDEAKLVVVGEVIVVSY